METTNKKAFGIGKFFVGLAVVFFGLVLLAQNAGWVDLSNIGISWSVFWPILLILLGLSMLSSQTWVGTIFGIIFAVFVLLVVLLLVFIPSNKMVNDEIKIFIANPASVYCEKQGGKSEIRENKDGSQDGYCVFSDKSECNEWLFLLKKCNAGDYVKKVNFIKEINIQSGAVVSSPIQISGQAVGNWYFEASFPIKIYDGNGKLLGATPAQAQTDWMVTSFVPFKATLTFINSTTATGTLVFEKDNPSGLPENYNEYRIPIIFNK